MDEREFYELKREVGDLRREAEAARKVAVEAQRELEEWRTTQQKEEAKRLRTALMAALGVIITLGGFVWAEIVWPVIRAGTGQ